VPLPNCVSRVPSPESRLGRTVSFSLPESRLGRTVSFSLPESRLGRTVSFSLPESRLGRTVSFSLPESRLGRTVSFSLPESRLGRTVSFSLRYASLKRAKLGDKEGYILNELGTSDLPGFRFGSCGVRGYSPFEKRFDRKPEKRLSLRKLSPNPIDVITSLFKKDLSEKRC